MISKQTVKQFTESMKKIYLLGPKLLGWRLPGLLNGEVGTAEKSAAGAWDRLHGGWREEDWNWGLLPLLAGSAKANEHPHSLLLKQRPLFLCEHAHLRAQVLTIHDSVVA